MRGHREKLDLARHMLASREHTMTAISGCSASRGRPVVLRFRRRLPGAVSRTDRLEPAAYRWWAKEDAVRRRQWRRLQRRTSRTALQRADESSFLAAEADHRKTGGWLT